MTSVVWIHIFLARHYNFRDDRVSFENSNLDNNYKSTTIFSSSCNTQSAEEFFISVLRLYKKEKKNSFPLPSLDRKKIKGKMKRKHRLQLSIRRVRILYT